MVYKVNLTNSEDLRELNSFLMNEVATLLYTSNDYISLLQSYLSDILTELWVAKDRTNKRIVGYFPIMFRLNTQYGNVCNSLPFYGSNGGITVSSRLTNFEKNEVRQELLNSVLKSIREKECVASTFITSPLDNESNKWLSLNLSYQLKDERIGQLTPLPKSEPEKVEMALMNLFEDPRPRNIRKAIKENISVYVSYDNDAFDFLYETHHHNITSINGIPKEKKFFECVKNTMPQDRYKIYVAEKQGEKIGALLLFYYNKTVEYFTPAIVEQYRHLQASSLLIYRAMVDASNEGYQWWNWGGTWLTQGGVYDFKKKWGTRDFPYFYYTCIYDNSILLNSKNLLLKEYPFFFVAPFEKLKN
jgi:hypothetical protein